MITMPDMAYISIFTDNDLTHITEDHFKIKLIARLLDQIYVIQPTSIPRIFAFATYPPISTGYGYTVVIYCT